MLATRRRTGLAVGMCWPAGLRLPAALADGGAQKVLLEAILGQIRLEHDAHDLGERGPRPPAQDAMGLRGVAAQVIYLDRTEMARIDLDVLAPVQSDQRERELNELADRVRFAGRD